MSSKAKKMSERIPVAPQTRNAIFKFDLELSRAKGEGSLTKVFYLAMEGIPVNLPDQFQFTIKQQAIKQFEANLNICRFIKLADAGMNLKDYTEKGKFYNIETTGVVEIKNVEEVTEEKIEVEAE